MQKLIIKNSMEPNDHSGFFTASAIRQFAGILFLLLLILTPGYGNTAEQPTLEYKIKAAYLYNFTKFTDWPEGAFQNNPAQALSICILGNDPFGHAIDLLAHKKAKGRKVVVYNIELEDIDKQCHVVFISRSKSNELEKILQQLSTRPILTVSDVDSFAMKGGCISLTVIKGKVRFNVNTQATSQAGLKISAKLLELARVVIE